MHPSLLNCLGCQLHEKDTNQMLLPIRPWSLIQQHIAHIQVPQVALSGLLNYLQKVYKMHIKGLSMFASLLTYTTELQKHFQFRCCNSPHHALL